MSYYSTFELGPSALHELVLGCHMASRHIDLEYGSTEVVSYRLPDNLSDEAACVAAHTDQVRFDGPRRQATAALTHSQTFRIFPSGIIGDTHGNCLDDLGQLVEPLHEVPMTPGIALVQHVVPPSTKFHSVRVGDRADPDTARLFGGRRAAVVWSY
jgi:hypothetical protein